MELLKYLRNLKSKKLYLNYYKDYLESEIKEDIIELIKWEKKSYLTYNIIKAFKQRRKLNNVIKQIKKFELLIAFREDDDYMQKVFLLFKDLDTNNYYVFDNYIVKINVDHYSKAYYIRNEVEGLERTILNSAYITTGMYSNGCNTPGLGLKTFVTIDDYIKEIR